MMRTLQARAEAAGARRAAAHVETLAARATELPAELRVDRLADGIAISGPGLVRRLAFDGRLRGLTLGLREEPR